jgi:hypothetical protein
MAGPADHHIDAALSALASATTPDEFIQPSNQAAASQVYARRAKLGMVAQNRCAEIRLRAERKLRGTPGDDPEAFAGCSVAFRG